MSFRTVLVANRGEIAVRVLRTVQSLGYRAVAVFSDADADAPHVAMADVAVRIGPPEVGESYLDPKRILDAARRSGADAVHPGYGFLSENAAFARACEDAGLVFIGPPADAIDAMGDKALAKQRMRAAGVPCVPGYDGLNADDAALIAEGSSVGFPLLVKASAGGGGRGMRRVDRAQDLPAALKSARAEAEVAFGSPSLLLERLVEGARHIEIQVMADRHGRVVHLGERDCSVQRRHQKVVEEAPSPAVDATLREAMGSAACRAAEAVGYVGAGTVEFLLGPDGAFYFLEMNTRLQVEHPVTEAVTGLDLVELQLRMAAGEALELPASVAMHGHAVEVRLYAEDPASSFLPSTGRLSAFELPGATGVVGAAVAGPRYPDGLRLDAGTASGLQVSSHYDPMLGKLVAWGPDRATACRRLARALDVSVVFGVRSNRRFLARVLRNEDFVCGRVDTGFLDFHDLTAELEADTATVAIAATLLVERQPLRTGHPWRQALRLSVDGVRHDVVMTAHGVEVDGHCVAVAVQGDGRWRRAGVDGVQRPIAVVPDPSEAGAFMLQHGAVEARVALWRTSAAASVDDPGELRAPMAGRVTAVLVAQGEIVDEGAPIVAMEAMKIETTLRSLRAGVILSLAVSEGDVVASGQVLATLEET